MTGTGKTDKKFHTLQHQISVVFICLLLLSIFTITLINGLFLEKYYVSKKVEVLEEAKEVLSQMNLDDILQYDTDIEEDKKGATDEISDEIERSSSRNNLTWIIVNEENSGYYYWGENNMAKMLRSKLFGYINNLDQDMQHSRVLKKTDTCTMWQVHDRFAGMEYVECWGQFDNGYYFLIRSPLESIKESQRDIQAFRLFCRPGFQIQLICAAQNRGDLLGLGKQLMFLHHFAKQRFQRPQTVVLGHEHLDRIKVPVRLFARA